MRRDAEIVTLDRSEGNSITLTFRNRSKPSSRAIRLGPDVAESLLTMLSLELDADD